MKADPMRVNPMRVNPMGLNPMGLNPMRVNTDRRDVRRVIDTATGLLVSAHRMTHSEAYRWLQANAMKRRTSLLAVADSVIAVAGRVPPMVGGTP